MHDLCLGPAFQDVIYPVVCSGLAGPRVSRWEGAIGVAGQGLLLDPAEHLASLSKDGALAMGE